MSQVVIKFEAAQFGRLIVWTWVVAVDVNFVQFQFVAVRGK